MMKKIRLGIFGLGRGMGLGRCALLGGAEIVAICDSNTDRLQKTQKELGGDVACYEDFDQFIEHPMDGVIVANYFHRHAPYAIKCLEKGIHVLSECTSNGTMAEGVQLVRAAQKSSAIYMLAENYPHSLYNREIKRVCDSGTLGKILFAEGEYNHVSDPTDYAWSKLLCGGSFEHWRNYLPRTYYLTHSLCPLMNATGAAPKKVTAFAAFAPAEGAVPAKSHVGDKVAIMLTHNDDGSVFRVTGCAGFGSSENSYRVCGTRGQVENVRGMDPKIMLRYSSWTTPEGAQVEQLYTPQWNDKDEVLIQKTGHGGGDFVIVRMFLDCIREGKQPQFPFDVHGAVAMASVGILGHRSVLEGGKPYDIPDFRREEDCLKYENDHLTPFFGENGEQPTIPCCSVPDYTPTQEQLDLFKKLVIEEAPEWDPATYKEL